MENIKYDNCIEELKKVKVCYSWNGVRQVAYSNTRSDIENEKFKLENITLYDVFFKYISKIDYWKEIGNKKIKTNYYKECEYHAKKHQEEKIKKLGKDYKFKLKDGAMGVWSFRDYRYKSSEDVESYRQWLGMQAFDGDFDVKSEKRPDALYTYDEAIELANKIRLKLYQKLCKYHWFCGIAPSTSGKGIHIPTYSIPFSVDLIKNENGVYVYDTDLDENGYIQRRKNMFQANYIHKLKYIFDELRDIWKEFDIKQPIETFFDEAMYKPEQPWNITPLNEGNLLINPNFKCEKFDEIYNEIYNGLDYDSIDETVKLNLHKKLDREQNEQENKLIKKMKTSIKVEDKVYNIEDGNGYYFGHDKIHEQEIDGNKVKVPMISQVIHTLKIFYTDEEQIEIWRTPGFYCFDADDQNVISWVKSYKCKDKKGNVIPQDEWSPNKYVINFLNTYCGFNIKYKTYTKDEVYEHCTVYNLKDNEYLSNYWDDILKEIDNQPGIYHVTSPTGSGKTKTHTDINEKIRENVLNNIVFNSIVEKPVLCTEPYKSILESKFDRETTEIITGSKHFDKGIKAGTLYVTNYIHFVMDIDVEDAKEFRYLIIDESHLITKEEFRAEQLVDFAKKLIELSQYCIIILQTATPMDEPKIFGNLIIRYFKLIKKDKRNISYNYLEYKGDDNFCLDMIYGLVRRNIDNGVKTYIYQPNISLDKCKGFANLFNDIDVCIFHKRLKENSKGKDKDSKEYQEYVNYGMKQLEETHLLDATHYHKKEHHNHKGDEFEFSYSKDTSSYKNYILLISSVYFGVGNDIDDEVDNACCIIIGNRTWQEDVQVFGRWRNAKHINVYEIVGNFQNGDVNDNLLNYNEMLRYKIKNVKYNFNDITNKQNSIVVRDKVYQIKDEKDIPLWACISICEEYHRNKNEKDLHLKDYVDEYNNNLEELEYSLETIEETKKFFKSLSNIRLKFKKKVIEDIMTGNEKNIKYSNVPKLDKWIKIVKRLFYNIGKDEFENILKNICSFSLMHSFEVFNNIFSNYLNDTIDYAEVAALEHYRKHEDIKQAFMIWYFCQGIDEPDYEIMGNWYYKFKWKAKCYRRIPQYLIDFLFSDVKIKIRKEKINQLETSSEFLGINLQDEIDKINMKVVDKYDTIGNIKKFKKTRKTIEQISEMIDKIESDKGSTDDKKKAGEKSKRNKSVVINENIKESRIDLLQKYNLKIGQVFMSCNDLAEYIGKSIQTVSKWAEKNWISNYI